MPQFDFTTYSSQIFWLLICFAVIYIFITFVIAPRIDDIIRVRKFHIESNSIEVAELNKKISQLQSESEILRQKAISNYAAAIDQASAKAAKERELALDDLKSKVAQMTKDFRSQLNDAVKASGASVDLAVKSATTSIQKNFFGKNNS